MLLFTLFFSIPNLSYAMPYKSMPFFGISGHYGLASKLPNVEILKYIADEIHMTHSAFELDNSMGASVVFGYNFGGSYLLGLNIEVASTDFSSIDEYSDKKNVESLSEDFSAFYLSLDKFCSLDDSGLFDIYFGGAIGFSNVDFFGSIVYENPDFFSQAQTLKASFKQNDIQKLFLSFRLGIAYNLNCFSSVFFGYKLNIIDAINNIDVTDIVVKDLRFDNSNNYTHNLEIGFIWMFF